MAMNKEFTEKQRELVARRLGYEGPMQMFDEFLKSNPATEAKYNTIGQKMMARGGMVRRKKYAVGGNVTVPTALLRLILLRVSLLNLTQLK
jgi:hypothetical protein